MATSPQVILTLVHEMIQKEDKAVLQIIYEIIPHEEETGETVKNRYLAIDALNKVARDNGFMEAHDLKTSVPHYKRINICRAAARNYA